jgi:diguanylate cyclase (GGDEF)-like protein/hemerythrin-like metal-binding protein
MRIDSLHGILPYFFDQSDIAIAIKALDGRYLFANRAYGRYAKVAPESIAGRRDAELLPAERVAIIQEAERSLIERGRGASCEERFAQDNQAVSYWSTRFPIRDDQNRVVAVGVVAVDVTERTRDRAETENALRATERANTQLRTAVETLEQIAGTDRLTDAWNRRRFDETVDSEIHRTVRYGYPLSVLVLDIDHFKRINDEFGHQVGDQVLVTVAKRAREVMRKSDSLTRWGGEEFIVLMPSSGLAEAHFLAERVRERISANPIDGVGQVTVSIGVAEYMPGEGPSQWVERADRAMYEAKRAGRNRVELDPAGSAAEGSAGNPGPLVQLSWRDAFHSGNELIDGQHRALFALSNELLDAVLTGRPSEELGAIVRRLLEDVVQHFRDEERILVATSYAGLVEHAREHALLVAKGLELAQQFEEGTVSVGSLFQFLVYDVVALHMLGADRKYYPWVTDRQFAAPLGGTTERATGPTAE